MIKNLYFISPNVLPFKTTIRITSMKWVTGFKFAITLAQPGMESIEVKSPLMSINIIMKKKATDIACCWVSE